ncbi:hypothetical protein Q3G72_027654 [Acer saccharum]|nr:hypothetical protein Q3G72_027654 [Acer saccharum]
MASISAMMMLSVILITISYFSFSSAISKDISFTAPLIHRSSPESPFYDPNATPLDFIKSSVRTSSARAIAFSNLNSKKNISGSIKYPVPWFNIINSDYVIKFGIGSPPMDTYGVADTGSGLTWLQCEGCVKCYPQAKPRFDRSQSSTYNPVLCGSYECNDADRTVCNPGTPQEQCHYYIEYVDGSYSKGDIATETFTFLDTGATASNNGKYSLDISYKNIIFGCGLDNSESFVSPGIVGLSNRRSSLVGQFGFRPFSYCVPADSRFQGQMRFGSAAKISGPTTKLAPNQAGLYYFQNVDGLYVNNEKVEGIPDDVFKFVEGGDAGGLLIDTGSSVSVFPSIAFDPLIEKLKEKMGKEPVRDETENYELCYDVKYYLREILPAIEIRFKDMIGGSLKLSNDNAWIGMPSDPPEYFCLAMIRMKVYTSILGMYQMSDLNVGIDLKLLQVSFMPNPNCPDYQ